MIDTLVDTEQETTSDFGKIDTLNMEADGDIAALFALAEEFIITSGIIQLTPWVLQPGPGRRRANRVCCEAVRKKI